MRYSPPNLDMEVYWYADRNGSNNFHIKVTERSSIDPPMILGPFIEIEQSKLGQWGLLGVFSCAFHNVTLYDSIFACKNIFALVSHTTSVGMTLILVSFFLILILILIILATKLSHYNSRTTRHRAMKLRG